MSDSPIGIFDSGVGGLTVCKAIRDLLPGENLIYFGDTARFPYGTRSGDTIIRYSREIAEYLVGRGVKMIVVACNTASAVALETLQREFPVPEYGPNGLIPKFNPEVWQPARRNSRREHYGQTILVGKKLKAPDLELVAAAPKPAAPGTVA